MRGGDWGWSTSDEERAVYTHAPSEAAQQETEAMNMLGVTDEEKRVLELTAQLWNAWIMLPGSHPFDAAETEHDIHNIQNRIMARVAVRTNPLLFHPHVNSANRGPG